MDNQNTRPYVKRILQRIPSKLLREHLKNNPPELTLLQWASIGGIVMRPNTQAKLYREMLPFAETDYERELLDSAVQDIDRVGCVDAQARAVYEKQHDPNVVPYDPFLERCNLPILLKKGNIAIVRRGAGKDAYLVWETPERIPACSDLTDESYYCYRLDGGAQENLFALHEHVHVCFADACAEDELSETQITALRFLQRKLNSEQSVNTDMLSAQCERARGYQGRDARALLQDMDQIIAKSEWGKSEMKSDTVVTQTKVTRTGAMQAFQALRAQAKDTGVSEMTPDEINEEIGKARSEEAE